MPNVPPGAAVPNPPSHRGACGALSVSVCRANPKAWQPGVLLRSPGLGAALWRRVCVSVCVCVCVCACVCVCVCVCVCMCVCVTPKSFKSCSNCGVQQLYPTTRRPNHMSSDVHVPRRPASGMCVCVCVCVCVWLAARVAQRQTGRDWHNGSAHCPHHHSPWLRNFVRLQNVLV